MSDDIGGDGDAYRKVLYGAYKKALVTTILVCVTAHITTVHGLGAGGCTFGHSVLKSILSASATDDQLLTRARYRPTQ